MVTRIPPMIATEPIPSDPDSTILKPCKQRDITSQQIIPMRPVLYFSYEGEVAVRGIAITPPSSIQDDDSHTATGDFCVYSVTFCMWHLCFYFNRQCSTKTLFFSTTTIWQVSIHIYYNMISKMKIIVHLNTITSAMKVKLKGWMLKQIQPTPFQSLIQRRRNLSMMIVTGLQVILICCVTVCKRCKCDTLLFISIGDAPQQQSQQEAKVSL